MSSANFPSDCLLTNIIGRAVYSFCIIIFLIIRQVEYDVKSPSGYDVYEATLTFKDDQEEVSSELSVHLQREACTSLPWLSTRIWNSWEALKLPCEEESPFFFLVQSSYNEYKRQQTVVGEALFVPLGDPTQ